MRYYEPTLGRWISPDPAGDADGPNLYAYVHNNPLRYFDQFGLFGLSLFDQENDIHENYYGKYAAEITYEGQPLGSPIKHVNIEDRLVKDFNFYHVPFNRTGVYSANDFINSQIGSNYNFKEMPQDKCIAFINGIDNKMSDFQNSVLYLAEMTGYNVKGIFCPTFGLTIDLMCYNQALDHTGFEGVRELQQLYKDFHDQSSPSASLLVIPHSRGAVYTRNSLIDSPKHLRDRVEVLAIAPGAYIDIDLCKSIRHFASPYDIVPRRDLRGRQRCKDTLTILDRHPDAKNIDHTFTSPTYYKVINDACDKYLIK